MNRRLTQTIADTYPANSGGLSPAMPSPGGTLVPPGQGRHKKTQTALSFFIAWHFCEANASFVRVCLRVSVANIT
jgi:hypothetical protein